MNGENAREREAGAFDIARLSLIGGEGEAEVSLCRLARESPREDPDGFAPRPARSEGDRVDVDEASRVGAEL